MSTSTEVILIESVFSLGALIALGGLIGLVALKKKHQALRPAMTVIVCGIGIAIIASLLNVLLFKSYAGVRVKKNQYYEITSLTTNMHASLASSQAPHQPVSPQAKRASRNVTYLVTHTGQSKHAKHLARVAQHQLTQHKTPNVTLVKANYQKILHDYFKDITSTPKTVTKLTHHAVKQVNRVTPR